MKMRKRKLLPVTVLKRIADEQTKGVPLTKIIANRNLGMSRAAIASLLKAYSDVSSTTVKDSLEPKWLDKELETAQEQPDDFVYIGTFPNGEWYEVN